MSVSVRLLMAPPTELNRMAAASMSPEMRSRLRSSLLAIRDGAGPDLADSIGPWLEMLTDEEPASA